MRTFIVAALAAVVCGFVSTPASAYTQCQVNVLDVWADNTGTVWIDFTNSNGAETGVGIPANTPGQAALMSLAITAKTTGRPVVVRYTADNESCAVDNADFVGMYLT